MLIGLEKEFFVKSQAPDGKEVYIMAQDAGLPYDECGYLAEARGKPCDGIVDAVFSLRTEVYRMQHDLVKRNQQHPEAIAVLDETPVVKLPKILLLGVRRRYAKNVVSERNIYDYISHKVKPDEKTAGVHISFTQPRETEVGHGKRKVTQTFNQMWDWLQVFKELDRAFATEIKAAKREPGFYELKYDGRIEYRSLPANVD